jgi:hypothetical protein
MTLLGHDQVTATVALVAQPPPTRDEEEPPGEDFGKSSPVGLLVILLFFVAVAFLVRSMTKHLKRVPASFDPPEEPGEKDGEKDSEKAPAENGDTDSTK